MQNLVNEAYNYAQISASANVCPRSGGLGGIFVSTGSGTIAVYDSASTGTSKLIVDAFTVTAGSFYPLPFLAAAGIYIVITGSVSATVAFSGT